MSVYDQIIGRLQKTRVRFQQLQHQPTKTCADAARIRGTSENQGAKALICIADKKPILITLPCSQKVDFKEFKKKFNIKDLRLATVEEVKELTGLEVGSIPPFGSLFSLPTYMHQALETNNEIAFNAGDVTKSIIMNCSDYILMEKPVKY